jgi:hypothetical protein
VTIEVVGIVGAGCGGRPVYGSSTTGRRREALAPAPRSDVLRRPRREASSRKFGSRTKLDLTMGKLLAIVLPLALGAAVTPTVVAAQLLSLTAKTRPLARAWALAGGCAVVLVGESVLALAIAAGSGGSDSPSRAGGIVKLVAAVLLVGLGARALSRRGTAPATPKVHKDERAHLGRSFALGAGLMATNFTSLVLYFPAMHAIGISDADTSARAVALVLLFSITLLPAVGPPLLVSALGERAQAPLDRLSRFFADHRQAIAATLCFGFAVLLGAAGLHAVL